MRIQKFLRIARRFKRSSKAAHKVRGFTLIELLVGLILTLLVIAPLLGFVVNIMNTDRQEQAKVRSEQELQAALEYISRDLQQAVYMYDSKALNTNSNPLPAQSGIKNQLPNVPDGVPVLVFWRRKLIEKSLPFDPNVTQCSPNNPGQCNDAFVYSLVAYYLIRDSAPNSPWSGTARIGRFEIQDGVKRIDGTANNGAYVNENDDRIGRDSGFKIFESAQGANLTNTMNSWRNSGENFPPGKLPQNNILVDYIDQSTNAPAQETYTGVTPPYCPPNPTIIPNDPGWTQVPDYTNGGIPAQFQTFSFYACVLSSQNTARVFLRGNALARIRNVVPSYDASLSSFFPTAKIEVKSSAGLGRS